MRTLHRFRPPAWALRALAPSSGAGPLPLAPALRGALGIGGPLAVGLAVGRPADAAAVALGALWAASQDRAAADRARQTRILLTGLTGALGLLIGVAPADAGSPLATAAGLTAVAAAAGAAGPSGPLASAAGLHLLLGACLGSGMAFPGPVWQAPALLFGGALLVLAMAGLPWLLRREQLRRRALDEARRAAAELLRASGTAAAPEARRRLTAALDRAADLLGPAARGGRAAAEHQALIVLAEAATALAGEGEPLPEGVTGAVADPGSGASVPRTSPGLAALDDALRAAPLPGPVRTAGRPRVPARERLRHGVLLGAAVLAAVLAADALHGPRGYWLPLTVAFVLKPDLGPLFGRALNRLLGTVGGVLLMVPVAVAAPGPAVLVGVAAVSGALLAVGVARHYGLATLALTPVVLVVLDLGGEHRNLLGARVLDTAVAAGIALLAGWAARGSASWRVRAAATVDEALRATAAYLREALRPVPHPVRRHALRRAAYRRLSEARQAAGHAAAEPGAGRPGERDALAVIAGAERLCDVAAAHLAHRGVRSDPVSEARRRARLDAALRELAAV